MTKRPFRFLLIQLNFHCKFAWFKPLPFSKREMEWTLVKMETNEGLAVS